MQDHLFELQQTLYKEIPITQHFHLTVGGYDERCLRLDAPLAENINHAGTAFGGSLSSLLTLAGWGIVWLIMREKRLEGEIVIQDGACNYLLPVTRDFSAYCHKPEEAQVARFERMLRSHGRARMELEATIPQADKVAVSFHGRYVVHTF
ncbi:MAG: thioesterase domain-containing protein [Ktedonobacteraceae bacterium]